MEAFKKILHCTRALQAAVFEVSVTQMHKRLSFSISTEKMVYLIYYKKYIATNQRAFLYFSAFLQCVVWQKHALIITVVECCSGNIFRLKTEQRVHL